MEQNSHKKNSEQCVGKRLSKDDVNKLKADKADLMNKIVKK